MDTEAAPACGQQQQQQQQQQQHQEGEQEREQREREQQLQRQQQAVLQRVWEALRQRPIWSAQLLRERLQLPQLHNALAQLCYTFKTGWYLTC